jgi:hypothetical protein
LLTAYFRTKPVYKGVPEASYHNPTRPVYLVVGGSGNDESKLFPGGVNSVDELQPTMPLSYQRGSCPKLTKLPKTCPTRAQNLPSNGLKLP